MTAATKIALISLVCCFVCAPTMFGDNVITQTCTIAQTAPPYTDSCTFNDFNTLLGPLNWVSLYLTDVGGNAQPQQTNIGGTDLTFSESYTTVIMTMTGPDGTVSTVSQSTPGAPPRGSQPGVLRHCIGPLDEYNLPYDGFQRPQRQLGHGCYPFGL